jgi:hypothetical protein
VTASADQPGALLARGVCRHLLAMGHAPVTEFVPAPGLRVDVIALDPAGQVIIVECKSCLADFRADLKWQGYRAWCDGFYFAVDEAFPLDVLPEDVGLIRADAWGAEVLRPAPLHPLAPARRRTLTLRLARKAAERLRTAVDPAFPIALEP